MPPQYSDGEWSGSGFVGLEARVTVRVYLAAARVDDSSPLPGDLPIERVFINAGDVREVWVETESPSVPAVGRNVGFALRRPMEIGFGRVTGTVERKVIK